MVAIGTLLLVLALSLLTVRVATVMLVLTGVSMPLARFQARSAFTGCGFTTTESEQIVNHPVRRRIVSTLMLMGSAGIITTVGTLIAGLTGVREAQELKQMADGSWELVRVTPAWPVWQRLTLLAGGLLVLWLISSSRFVERLINRITFHLLRKYTRLEVRDYARLMHLSGDYAINELLINEGDWLAGKPLSELRLSHEGVIVLGIQRRDGTYVGAPRAQTVLEKGDVAIVYGRLERLAEVDERRSDASGVLRHMEAVADQRVRVLEEREKEQKDLPQRSGTAEARRRAQEERDAVQEHVASVIGEGGSAAT